MVDWTDPHYIRLRQVIIGVREQPRMLQELQASQTMAEAMKMLGIPTEDVRTDMLNILSEIPQLSGQGQASTMDSKTQHNVQEMSTQEVNSAQKFFEQAFSELRRAYLISLAMSILVFLVGIGFLVLAAVQTIIDPSHTATTAVVGGIGVVQIIALFYRNPLNDIARSVSNAQQAKITLTSYLIGVSMIRDSIGLDQPEPSHLESLSKLTELALTQLQTYVEVQRKSRNNKGSGAGSE
jgi:hypothetical protein